MIITSAFYRNSSHLHQMLVVKLTPDWSVSELDGHTYPQFGRVRIRGFWICPCQSLKFWLCPSTCPNSQTKRPWSPNSDPFGSIRLFSFVKFLFLFVFQAIGPTSVESNLDRRLPSVSHQLLTVQVPVGLIQLNWSYGFLLWISEFLEYLSLWKTIKIFNELEFLYNLKMAF